MAIFFILSGLISGREQQWRTGIDEFNFNSDYTIFDQP